MNYLEFVKYLLSLEHHKHIVDIEGYYYMFYAAEVSDFSDDGANKIIIESNFSNFPLLLSVPYFLMKLPIFNMGFDYEDKLIFKKYVSDEFEGTELRQSNPIQFKPNSEAPEAQIYKEVAINTFIYLPAKTTIYTFGRDEIFQLCYINSDIAEKNKNLFKLGGF